MLKVRVCPSVFLLLSIVMVSCNIGEKVHKKHKALKVSEWRGPNRSGIYNETKLFKVWPENGPELVWDFDGLGNGYGSPIFTDNKMFIMGEIDTSAYLFAFNLKGELLWKKAYGNDWVENYSGARSAPTIVDDLLYFVSGLGVVNCIRHETGEKVWSVDMVNDLNGTFPMFGYSESVIIEDEKLFCTPGGKDTNVVALNRYNGELIWISKGAGERPGYNSAQIIELANRNVLVNFTAYELLGHDTKTGELLWVHNQDNIPLDKRRPGAGDTHSNTIIYDDGFIYYAAGDGNCGVNLALSSDGDSITEVWRNKDFDSYMGGIIKLGNHLYGCGTAKRDLKSVNAETGQLGMALKVGSGALIAADSMLYYYNYKGEVMLITSDPLNMEVVSKFKIQKGTAEHFAHPVINKGILYVRHGNAIQAFDIAVKAN